MSEPTVKDVLALLAKGDALPTGWSYDPRKDPPVWRTEGRQPKEAEPATNTRIVTDEEGDAAR